MTKSGSQTKDGGRRGRRLSDLLAAPRFYWATFFALLAILLAIGIYNVDLPDTGQNPVSPSEASNVRDWMIVLIVAAAAAWLGYVIKLLNRRTDVPASAGQSLFLVLFEECRGMAQYALEHGQAIESADVIKLQEYERLAYPDNGDDTAAPNGATDEAPDILAEERRVAIGELNGIHTRLAKVVDPAMPKTLRLLATTSSRFQPTWPGLGQIRIVRRMVGLVAILIPTFIALAVSVGARLDTADGLYGGNAIDKFESAMYIVVASALGAAFAALYKVYGYIRDLSYDDNWEGSYWVRFVQGLVSGVLLATIIAQTLFSADDVTDPDSAFRVTIPLLALVGGFSSDLLYRVLEKIIEAIESLVRGSTKERVELEKQRSASRFELQDIANEQKTKEAMLKLQTKVAQAGSIEGARQAVEQSIEELDNGSATPATPTVPDGGPPPTVMSTVPDGGPPPVTPTVPDGGPPPTPDTPTVPHGGPPPTPDTPTVPDGGPPPTPGTRPPSPTAAHHQHPARVHRPRGQPTGPPG